LNDFENADNIKDENMTLTDKEKQGKDMPYRILYNWGITLRRVGNDDQS
jgi:hypothetical protein